jgi:hypothetical protein
MANTMPFGLTTKYHTGDAAPANPKAAYDRSPFVKAPSSPPAVAGPNAVYARSPLFKEPAPTDLMAVDEPEVSFDTDWDCDEDVDKRVGLRFIPINHQHITVDQRNVRRDRGGVVVGVGRGAQNKPRGGGGLDSACMGNPLDNKWL